MLVKYIEPLELAALLRSEDTCRLTLVVDVRDCDYEVGKIRGSINVPYESLHQQLGLIAKAAVGKTKVVFHCHFSARRGPAAAEAMLSALNGAESGPEVAVLRGGFQQWYRLYKLQSDLYEEL